MRVLLLLLKSYQMDLFGQTVPVAGYVRKDGTAVKPHQAGRKVKRRRNPAGKAPKAMSDEDIVDRAKTILKDRLRTRGLEMSSPSDVVSYLQLNVASKKSEVFGALFMDTRHQLIENVEMFNGTINGASVHAREVVMEALKHNAAAVVLYHNHPSGVAEPSRGDIVVTQRLKDALALVEVRVLDHIIVGGDNQMQSLSFSERGLM